MGQVNDAELNDAELTFWNAGTGESAADLGPARLSGRPDEIDWTAKRCISAEVVLRDYLRHYRQAGSR
jgi:hypothetical protein